MQDNARIHATEKTVEWFLGYGALQVLEWPLYSPVQCSNWARLSKAVMINFLQFTGNDTNYLLLSFDFGFLWFMEYL